MEHTFDTSEPIDLTVELPSGEVHGQTTDDDITHVEVIGPRADEFEVRQEGRRILVLAPRTGWGGLFKRDKHEVRVSMPVGSDVTTNVGSADTELSGEYGRLDLKTGSGDVRIEEAAGPIVVASGSGDVEADTVGQIRIKSGSGDIELGEADGEVAISTGSGDVTIGRVREAAVVKTGSGNLEVNRAEADVTLNTASGDLVVATAVRGRIGAKNASGDIVVGIPAGTPVWTDVSTVTGSIRNQLSSTGAPTEGQPHVEVRVKSVSGDVLLREA